MKQNITINASTVEILRHIYNARIDNAHSPAEYTAWATARDVIEYALANNVECLTQFDYLLTREEEQKAE